MKIRVVVLFAALVVGVVVMALVSASVGQFPVPLREVIASAFGGGAADPAAQSTLWNIRFPRVLMSLLVGAVLGVTGALMQGIFGNPLAEPGVVGVSLGAAVGACLTIVFQISFLGQFTTPAFAFTFGLATTMAVYTLSRARGKTEVVTLLLTGIAVNAVAGAAIAFLTFLGDQQAREQIVFWQLGSIAGSRWPYVWTVIPLAAAGLVIAMLLARRMDLLSLGERSARHLGVNVEALRVVAIVLVALMVSAAVSFTGVIAFVGLVVPHAIRMVVGPGHRVLLPASALGGALLLVSADLLARGLIRFVDLPIGMLTALVGGPLFFFLLRRTRRRAGGWA
ncbi:FecCD family ABC transporter permease [Actinosynnema sp. ALI-1.44]|uniref:FecCD family ABC transporter permease n=1 Tax=Actinosynnema sp. ALI-1.44 TaxID=1933779 RepID=UPI001EDAFA14|nr:iron ABC transporter permease [Actinosynnema sp. ALI-1.44]